MKVLIAVPCMDQVPAQFAQCLATLGKVDKTIVAFQIGSLVYTSRNDLVQIAIKQGCDYIFWLDSDMMFPPDVLVRMFEDLKHGDIVSGLYFRRVAPFTPVIYDKLDIDDTGCHYTEPKDIPDGIFEVAGCGFGCVLMPTDIMLDVLEKYGSPFTPINGIGEDLSFCWRARQLGFKIVCDPDIPLGHVGHHVITRELYEAVKQR